ncbi:MAG: glycosyltransferase family 4 protein [Arenimonas sp.]
MKPAIRVLVLFGNVPLLGQERGNIDVLDALQKKGAEVLFLIREEWTRDTIQAELARRNLRWTTVPFFDALRKGHGPWVWIRNLAGIVGGSLQLLRWHWKFRPTHLHVSSVSNTVNFLPALLLVRTPLIYRAGDDITLHHWFWRAIWRFTRWRTDRFAAISRFIAERLIDNGVAAEKISLVSNISPPRTANAEKHELQISKEADKCTFVYVGQLTHQKGVDLLVEAAIAHCRHSEKTRFVIAGDFSWENDLAVALKHKVEGLGLSERILFVGYTQDVSGLLSECDVHICPSVGTEAYGNVVIEAKQESLPSIIFPTGGLQELVADGVNGWVCKTKTQEALIEAFAYYEKNPEMIALQGVAAMASLTDLGAGRFDKDWQEVYENV